MWEWFCEIRTMNGDDFSAQAVQSWFSLHGIKPAPFEVQAVMGIWRCLCKSQKKPSE
ncbi:MAG: hypothetical protein Tp136SUR676911_42 [Prokaryotic dsDNA virus sp.]|nr:MAG: hypothetical protein Tp136SUR676911_42 [Prokaryotic dsDNA virus sp.]